MVTKLVNTKKCYPLSKLWPRYPKKDRILLKNLIENLYKDYLKKIGQ